MAAVDAEPLAGSPPNIRSSSKVQASPHQNRHSFANKIAKNIGDLAWLLVTQHEHDTQTHPLNSDFMCGQFLPVVSKWSQLQKQIATLRGHGNYRRANSHVEEMAEEVPFEVTGCLNEIMYCSEGSSNKDSNVGGRLQSKLMTVPADRGVSMTSQASRISRVSFAEKLSTHGSSIDNSMSILDEGDTIRMPDVPSSCPSEYEGADKPALFTAWPIWRASKFAPGPSFNNSWDLTMIQNKSSMDSASKLGVSTCSLAPGSAFRMSWDVSSIVFILYDVIRIPLEFVDLPEVLFTEAMSWITRLFWSVDLILNFFTGYIKPDGLSEMRLKSITQRYARTWLIPDILILACDWVSVFLDVVQNEAGITRAAKASRGGRALRSMRLFRIGKAIQFLSLQTFAMSSAKLVVVLDILKILMLLVGFTHVIACLWYGLGVWHTQFGQETWMYASNLQDASVGNRYMMSCLWALSQFSGGSDYAKPQNFIERLFNTLILLNGFVASAAFVSVLTSATTKLLLITSGPAKQLAQLRYYLSQNPVSQRLMLRIQRNAQHLVFEKRRLVAEEDVELLRLISEPLQMELALEVRSPILVKHGFFRTLYDSCIVAVRQLCFKAVISKLVAADDILFVAGEKALSPHMFFLVESDGKMKYQQFGQPTRIINCGQWVAEPVLWTDWRHLGTLKAVNDGGILAVNSLRFQGIVKGYDDALQYVRSYALDFVEKLNEMEQDELSDILPDCWFLAWRSTFSFT